MALSMNKNRTDDRVSSLSRRVPPTVFHVVRSFARFFFIHLFVHEAPVLCFPRVSLCRFF